MREQNIQLEINDVNNGKSQREAAKLWEISPSTLSDRIHGSTTKAASKKITTRKLSPAQETFLVEWCLDQETAGRAPSKVEITRMGQEILAQGGDFTPIGYR